MGVDTSQHGQPSAPARTGAEPSTRTIARPRATATGVPTERAARGTRALLACGVVAGPLFLATGLIQAFTREGFDLRRHPLSLLSLGDLGWLQIANFVATGALSVACAVGMRRVLGAGRSGTWGPALVGLFGVGLIAAGVFVVDPGAGFPAGAPTGAPERLSWHGILHEIGFLLAVNGMGVGCLVFIRRFAALKRWGWAGACVATPVASYGLALWPDPDGLSVRLVIASALLFGFVAALAARLMRGFPDSTAARPGGSPDAPIAPRAVIGGALPRPFAGQHGC